MNEGRVCDKKMSEGDGVGGNKVFVRRREEVDSGAGAVHAICCGLVSVGHGPGAVHAIFCELVSVCHGPGAFLPSSVSL